MFELVGAAVTGLPFRENPLVSESVSRYCLSFSLFSPPEHPIATETTTCCCYSNRRLPPQHMSLCFLAEPSLSLCFWPHIAYIVHDFLIDTNLTKVCGQDLRHIQICAEGFLCSHGVLVVVRCRITFEMISVFSPQVCLHGSVCCTSWTQIEVSLPLLLQPFFQRW